MALFDDGTRGYIIGAAAALAAAAVIREFGTEFRDLGRPLAKATIKSGLALLDKGREVMAHLSETVEDLVVEARYELDASRAASAAPAEHGTADETVAEPTENRNQEVH
jgi:hypothetical protein